VSTTPPSIDDPTVEATEADGRSRRFGRTDRVQTADVLGLLASCIVILIAFAPVLFGGRMISTAGKGAAGTNGVAPFPFEPAADYSPDFRPDQGASTWQFEPWVEVNHRAYSQGDLPLWNPYQALGAPLAANMQSAAFDPLLLPVNLHPTPRTWDFAIIGAFLLGAIASYLFARVLGMAALPSFVASSAFSLSGYFFLYSNNQFSRSYIYLPILFLLVELVLRSRRLWPVFGLGLAIAGNFYVGMPEASFFVIGSATLYAGIRVVQQRRTTPWRRSLARLGGGSLLGVLLSAPLLLLFRQYEALSFNTHKSGAGQGTLTDAAWGLLNWIVPFFHGIRGSFLAPGVRNWVGVAVLVTALLALSGRTETKRLHAWFFFGLGALLLLKVYDFGILEWVGRLPVAERITFALFATPVVGFTFAVLAGIGVQVLWKSDLDVRRFLILLASTAALLAVLAVTGDRWKLITQPTVHYELKVWGRAAAFGLLVIGAALLSVRFKSRWWAFLAVVAIVAELFTLAPFSIYAKRADPFATPGWMTLVAAAQQSEPDSRVFAIDTKLFPNTASALGLQDIRALDALYVERYWRYVQTFIEPTLEDRFTGGPPVEPNAAHFEDNPMFDALAVQTILSQQDLANVSTLRFLGQDLDTRVYENADAYPRAWLVHNVHIVNDEDAAFGFLTARSRREDHVAIVDGFDPRHEAVVESSDHPTDAKLGGMRNGSSTCDGAGDQVTIQDYSAQSVTLRVDAACAGLLVLPDTYYPGWSATVNGRARTIYATDGAFRGVTVPEGSSTVVFHYRPRPFAVGIVLALVGLAGFGAIAGLGMWRRRRRSPSQDSADEQDPTAPLVVPTLGP
jgi:hypothetical protein